MEGRTRSSSETGLRQVMLRCAAIDSRRCAALCLCCLLHERPRSQVANGEMTMFFFCHILNRRLDCQAIKKSIFVYLFAKILGEAVVESADRGAGKKDLIASVASSVFVGSRL